MQLFRWTKTMWHEIPSTTKRFETVSFRCTFFLSFECRKTEIHSLNHSMVWTRKFSKQETILTFTCHIYTFRLLSYFKFNSGCNECGKMNEENAEIRRFNQMKWKGAFKSSPNNSWSLCLRLKCFVVVVVVVFPRLCLAFLLHFNRFLWPAQHQPGVCLCACPNV